MKPNARLGAPRHDCLEEEEEEGEAELLVRFDLLREPCVDGGVRRRLGQLAAMAPLGLGLLQQGEKEGEEEQVVVGVAFILQGGPWSEEEAGEATGARRPWCQCVSWRHSEGRDDRWVPLSVIFLFPVFRISRGI